MRQLVQLPSGDWIDPNTVTFVRVVDEFKGSITHYPIRVIVGTAAKIEFSSPSATLEAAAVLRDEIVALVNGRNITSWTCGRCGGRFVGLSHTHDEECYKQQEGEGYVK